MTDNNENGENGDGDGLSDPDGNYVQQRRLEDIFDARAMARQKKLDAQEMRDIQGEPVAAASMYRAAIENFITETEPLTKNYPAPDYWNKFPLGTIELPPPETEDGEELVQPTKDVGVRKGDEVELLSKEESRMMQFEQVEQDYEVEVETFQLAGLRSILNAPTRFSAEYTVKSPGVWATETETRTVDRPIPLTVLENARRVCNLYLADIGIIAKPDDTRPDYDYRSGGAA